MEISSSPRNLLAPLTPARGFLDVGSADISKVPRIGRPPVKASVNDPAAIELLRDRLVSGLGMHKACEVDECPSETAVYKRMATDEAFARVIARAREARQDAVVEQIIDLADSATPENWQVVRLQIWARQWCAAKLAPKKYGDKLEVAQTLETGFAEKLEAARHRASRIAELSAKLSPRLIEGEIQPEPAAAGDAD